MINHVFDELALYFLEYPTRYEVFSRNTIYDNIISNKTIDDIEFRCYIHIF